VIAVHLLIGQRTVANRVVQIRSTAQLLILRCVLRIVLDMHFPKPKAGVHDPDGLQKGSAFAL